MRLVLMMCSSSVFSTSLRCLQATAQRKSHFTDVDSSVLGSDASYTEGKSSGGACETICQFNRSLRSRNCVRLGDERPSPIRRTHFILIIASLMCISASRKLPSTFRI